MCDEVGSLIPQKNREKKESLLHFLCRNTVEICRPVCVVRGFQTDCRKPIIEEKREDAVPLKGISKSL